MATKHVIKNTETEIIFKCYITASEGGNVDISLQNDMTKSTQVYVTPDSIPDETGGAFVIHTGSRAYITGLWWGVKNNKQLDIVRIINPVVPTYHNHYYFTGSGSYDFSGADFSDRIYGNKDIRLTFDGPGHCIIRFRKEGWNPKVETAQFSVYDNLNTVGS
jgi:hypothetical protein